MLWLVVVEAVFEVFVCLITMQIRVFLLGKSLVSPSTSQQRHTPS